jgi:putative heme-binding domain-containing protein
VLEGFVTRESDEEIELRNLTGTATLLKKSDVKQRGKRDTSMMPTELADKLSTKDLASLVAYLESLKAQ